MNQALWAATEVGKNDDRRTPRALFRKIDTHFQFDLDAAAIEENALCPTFISPEEDSLSTDWSKLGSSVWCNPPYGRSIPLWLQHAQKFTRTVRNIVFLLPARTDTKWFYEASIFGWDVVLLHGRVTFEPYKTSPNFGSCLLIHNQHVDYPTSVWDWKRELFEDRAHF